MVRYNQMELEDALQRKKGKTSGSGGNPIIGGRGKYCIYCRKEELIAVREYLQKLKTNVVLEKEVDENG
jgi:hypothetical protein